MDWIFKLNYKCQFFLVVPLRLKPGSLLPFASLRIKKLQIQFFATIIYFPTTRSRVGSFWKTYGSTFLADVPICPPIISCGG